MRCLVLALACSLVACNRTPEAPPLVYSVTQGGHAVGYVYGTVHHGVAMPDADAAELERTVSQCTSLNVEIDAFDKDLPDHYARAIVKHLPAKSWLDVVPSTQFPVVVSLGKKAGVDAMALHPGEVHPIYLVGLAMRQCEKGRHPADVSMDKAIQQMAQRHGVAVVPMESATEAAAPFAGLDRAVWAAYLSQADRFIQPGCEEPADAHFNGTLEALRNGDADAVRRASLDIQRVSGLHAVHTPMVFGREAALVTRFIDRFKAATPERKVCAMLGAAHLAGSDGILHRLTLAGYQVHRTNRGANGRVDR